MHEDIENFIERHEEDNSGIRVGDRVKTLVGDRLTKIKHSGTVVRFTKWRDFKAAVVRRDSDGSLKTYLVKNLIKTKEGK